MWNASMYMKSPDSTNPIRKIMLSENARLTHWNSRLTIPAIGAIVCVARFAPTG